jgi:DNA invertase Pin-like site-specific DNA recombinase
MDRANPGLSVGYPAPKAWARLFCTAGRRWAGRPVAGDPGKRRERLSQPALVPGRSSPPDKPVPGYPLAGESFACPSWKAVLTIPPQGGRLKVGLYARVSRDDGTQTVENQLHELRGWAERLGGTVIAEYVDRKSGATEARPGLRDALQAAHERRFDVLLLWSLDRLSRGGIEATASLLRRFRASGVGVRSLRETWLDTSDPHMAELLVAMMSWFAAQERRRLSERTKAGMARAKRQGIHLGRPRKPIDADQAQRALAKAGSIRGAARLLRVDESLVRRRLA